ncbi:TlpA disulfide reductase family protein [Pedobacter sp. KR3-3]|uniref:TlpA disulfide reductase family protein n=1 Tax=Pedobacter albus TaxID=3113905 RepID=A0ABU7IAY8_9SPHI|nr:TlpA disulfide reductase family protein [Pedobacter sp. KR3-3]MEE1946633.1 TlpA disulfide reductase family protein [Pedobacter sp. KR3-3]
MKKLGILLLAISSCYAAVAQNQTATNYFNEKDSVQISGKIIGYKPGQGDHFMTFSTYDLRGKATNEAIQIKENGDFWIKLYQPFEGDMLLNYKDAFIDLYTKPGTVIRLEINNDKISSEKNNEGAVVAFGQFAALNNLLFRFHQEFAQQPFSKVNMGDKTQSDSLYAARKMARLDEQLRFLDSFVKQHQVKDQFFINWKKNELQYKTGIDILFFPFAGKFNDKIVQSQLLKIIEAIPINNPGALNNSAYYGFLKMLSTGQEIMVNINPSYDLAKKQTGNVIDLYLNEVDKFSTGPSKDILHYNLLVDKASFVKDTLAWDRQVKTISNPFLRQKLIEKKAKTVKGFTSYAILDRLQKLKANKSLKQKLIDLFTQTKGTNLYIDFWGDWCGPCMAEMPSYPRLIDAFKGKPLKFLFLSAFTTEENMLAVKKKYGIEAEFVNLNKDEVAILNNVFEFYSYPSHFLVNSEGRVVANTLGHVGEGAIGEKVQAFDKILNQK